MENKEINNINETNEEEYNRLKDYVPFVNRKRGFVSEFFNHMIAYGGFSSEEGVMKIWGDPSIFIPLKSFCDLLNLLEAKLGMDFAHEIYYWLGKLYGFNSSTLLIKKFGFNPKQLPDFVNGATQDGMGYVEITKYIPYKDGNVAGEITGTNSVFALTYKEKKGKTDYPIDFYLLGVLAGGSEPLFNKYFKGAELKCMAKGDKNCFYIIKSQKEKEKFKIFSKVSFSEEEILKKTKKLTLSRKSSFKILGRKGIKFGDGSFILYGYTGINLPSYSKVILDKFLYDKYGIDFLNNLNKSFSESCIINLKNEKIKPFLDKGNLHKLFKHFQIFGLGTFNIIQMSPKSLIIRNDNNPYIPDYLFLFKKREEFLGTFEASLIQSALKVYFNKNSIIKRITIKDNKFIIQLQF